MFNSNKTKIAIVCSPLGFKGGTFKHLLNWVNNFDYNQYEVALYCSYISDADRFEADKYLKKIKNIEYYSEPWMFPVPNLLQGGFIRLFRSIKNFSPDIIHSVFVQADVIGSLLKVLTHAKHISSWEGELVGSLLHSQVKKFFYAFVYRFSDLYIDKYIAISKATAIQNGSTYSINADKIETVHSGLDLSDKIISVNIDNREKEQICIGLVSRLTAEKKIDIFIKAIRKIIDHADVNLRFIVVGDGDQRNYLTDTAKQIGVDDYVDFIGWSSDVSAILKGLDIFVFTSSGEGLPWSILEAQAAGVPVVSSDVGGISEAIIDEKTGILVKTNTPEEFASKIIKLINSPKKRSILAKNAKNRVCEYFTIERELKDIMEIYQEILDNQR